MAVGAAIVIAGAGSAGYAQGVIAGSYIKDEARSDDAFQVIEAAIAGLPDANRHLARIVLRKSIAVHRMRMSVAGKRVGITYDDKAPIIVWVGGEPVKWKLIEVLVFNVSATADGEDVILKFSGEHSTRTMNYRLVGEDLVVNSIMNVPALSTPIAYRQVFKRAN